MNSRFLKQKLLRRPRDRDLKRDYDETSYALLADCSDSDSGEGHLPLKSKQRKQNYIDHILQSGETLSSLALRYNCSVAQIKQANNILRENEIFALRTVRIPVSAFSLLREGVAGVHGRFKIPVDQRKQFEVPGDCSSSQLSSPFDVQDTPNTGTQNSNQPEETLRRLPGNEEDEGICNPLLTPVPQPLKTLILMNTEPPDLELPPLQVQQNEGKGIFYCSGADGGLSWLFLVVCSLALGIAGPLLYIFFLYENDKIMHNITSVTNSSHKL